ncbi:MAG: M12 family metallo-peptidase [Gammaproteobacteria bacterium]|jgi:hypothetical protein
MLPSLAIGRHISIARFAVALAACALAAQASARDFSIRYHERISPRLSGAGTHLSFVAAGRQFDVELRSNAGILALAPGEPPPAVALYRGRLSGQPDSWARISRHDGHLRGAIFDGEELWLIDTAARLAGALEVPEAAEATVIFPLSEVSGDFGDVLGDVRRAAASAQPGGLPQDAVTLAVSEPAPAVALDIGLVATPDFAERHGARARAAVLELFNVVEGIFVTQVGVQLRASQVAVLDSTPDLLASTDAAALLDGFANWKRRDMDFYSLGLAHLFVGRDLDDSNPPQRTVGIANVGVLCDRRYGVGLTQATSTSMFDALIATHEIAHNFGAPHDGDPDFACAAVSDGYIMAPQLRSQTRFSQCSVAQMLPEIAAAACMKPISSTNLQLSVARPPPLTVEQNAPFDFEVVVANLSGSAVAGLELSATVTGLARPSLNTAVGDDSYCDYLDNRLRCVWPSFAAGRSLTLNLSSAGREPGPGSIALRVDSLSELDPSDNALSFEVAVASGDAGAAIPAAGAGSSAGGDESTGGGGSLGAASAFALASLLALRRRRQRQFSRPRAHQGQ